MDASSSKRSRSSVQPASIPSASARAMELSPALGVPDSSSSQDSPVIAVCTDQNLIKFIFQRLDIADLCAAASVCHLWNEVSNSEDFWSEVSFQNKVVYPNQVAAVLYRHQCVQKIDFSGLKCGLNDGTLFRRIAPYLQQLRELHFSYTPGSESRVHEKVISTISESLPALKTLDLQGVALQWSGSPSVLSHAGLETLRVTGSESFSLVLRCRSLQSLSLADSQMLRLPSLSECPALVNLDCKGCKKLHDGSIRGLLPGLSTLQSLQLGKGVPVTDDTMRDMAALLTSLTQLVLAETPGLTLTNVRGFPSLRVLDLSRCEGLTPAGVQPALESFTALQVLLMDNCHTLSALKLNLPHLKEISLRGCGSLSDLELNCWRLAVLSLGPVSRGAPGNMTLQRLAVSSGALRKMEWVQCRKLAQLELNCPHLTDLVIRDCDNITPAALEALGDQGPPPTAAVGLLPVAAHCTSSRFTQSMGSGLGFGSVHGDADPGGNAVVQHFAAALWQQDGQLQDDADGEVDFSPRFEPAAGVSADDEDDEEPGDGDSDSDGDGEMIGPLSAAAAAASGRRRPSGFAGWAWGGPAAAAAGPSSSARQPRVAPPVTRTGKAGTSNTERSASASRDPPSSSGVAGSEARPSNAAAEAHSLDLEAMEIDDCAGWLQSSMQQPLDPGSAGPQQQQGTEPRVNGPSRLDSLSAMDHDNGGQPGHQDSGARGGPLRMTRQRRALRRDAQAAGNQQHQQQQQAGSSHDAGTASSSGGLLWRLPSLRMPGWRAVAEAPAAAAEAAAPCRRSSTSEGSSSAGGAAGPFTRGLTARAASGPQGLLGLPLPVGQSRGSRTVGAQRGQTFASQPSTSPASIAPASAAAAAAASSIPMVVTLTGDRGPAAPAAGARGGGSGPTPPPIPSPPQQPAGGRGGVPQLRRLRVEGCDGLRRFSLKHSGLESLSVSTCRSLSTLVVEAPKLSYLELDEVGELQGISLQKVGLPSIALGGCSGLSGLELSSTLVKRLDLRGCGQLQQLLLDCPALSVMDATFCSEMGNVGLASAVAKAPPLIQLVLSVCPQIGSAGLLSLSSLSTLQELDLSYTEVTNLESVFSSCPQLKNLSLSSCRSLKCDALAPLLSAEHPTLRQLTSLDASYCNLDESIIAQLLTSCSRLKHLALNGCSSVTDQLWQQLEQSHLMQLQQRSLPAAAAIDVTLDMDSPATDLMSTDETGYGSGSSSSLESLSLVKCSNLKSLCLGLLPTSGQVEVLQPKHYLLAGDREALHARSAKYSWVEVPSAVCNLNSLRLGLSGVQVVALALPKLAHLDLSSCGHLRVLELRCPLLLTLHLQACRSLPMYAMAQAVVRCPQLEKLDVQHVLPGSSSRKSESASDDAGTSGVLAAAVGVAPGAAEGQCSAAQLEQLLDDLSSGHPSLQRVLRCSANCGVCSRAATYMGA